MKSLLGRAPFGLPVQSSVFVVTLAIGSLSLTPVHASTTPVIKATPVKSYNRSLDADLRAAVSAEDASKVRSLLSRNADPNIKDADSFATPALCNAASNGNIEIVRALIEAGADLEGSNLQGNAPLIFAALHNRVEVIRYLIQKGAKVDANKYMGLTALMIAASSGHSEAVRTLMDLGANVNARSTSNGTPLIYGSASTSAGTGKIEILKMLVDAGADVSVKATNGKNAQQTANTSGLRDLAAYLQDIFNRDTRLYNALLDAAKNNDSTKDLWKEVKAALDSGANPRYTADSGLTPLMLAAYGVPASYEGTAQRIVARSDLNATKEDGKSALHVAVLLKNPIMVRLLVSAGANINLTDQKNQTPLDLARKENAPEITRTLENAGAKTYHDLQSPSSTSTSSTRTVVTPQAKPVKSVAKGPLDVLKNDGKSELMQAAYDGDNAKIAQLLSRGATIDFANDDEHTALFFAAYGGSVSSIKALVKAGANINYLDIDGKTPLVSASFAGDVATLRALIEAGADLKHLEAAIAYAKDGENTAAVEYLSSPSLKIKAKGIVPNASAVKAPAAKAPAAKTPDAVTNASTADFAEWEAAVEEATIRLIKEPGAAVADEDIYMNLRNLRYGQTFNGEIGVAKGTEGAYWKSIDELLIDVSRLRFLGENGMTNLMWAAFNLPGANDATVQKIVALSEVNVQDDDGSSALHFAAETNYTKMISWLVKAGAKLNLLDSEGLTPLDIAVANKSSEAVTLLKSSGAKYAADLKKSNVAASSTQTTPKAQPTPQAASLSIVNTNAKSTTDLLKLLRTKPFDAKAAEALLKSGADIKTPDALGKTPLMMASEAGTVEAVEWLVLKKVNVNAVDKKGMNALMYAASRSDDGEAWKVVGELVLEVADANLKNKDGKTAHELALSKGNSTTVLTLDIAAED